jgi:hypothetical protein
MLGSKLKDWDKMQQVMSMFSCISTRNLLIFANTLPVLGSKNILFAVFCE